MTEPKDTARRKAGAAAALLLLTGVLLGIALDRLWLTPAVAGPVPALPPAARAGFRAWLHAHHRHMMERAGSVRTHDAEHGAT